MSRFILAAAKTVYVVSTRCTAVPVAQSGGKNTSFSVHFIACWCAVFSLFRFLMLTADAFTFFQCARFFLRVAKINVSSPPVINFLTCLLFQSLPLLSPRCPRRPLEMSTTLSPLTSWTQVSLTTQQRRGRPPGIGLSRSQTGTPREYSGHLTFCGYIFVINVSYIFIDSYISLPILIFNFFYLL